MKYIIEDKQKFKQYREVFRARSRNKQATILDHLLYNIVRDRHVTHGFTPITNERKLNGDAHRRKWLAVHLAIQTFRWHISSRARFLSRADDPYHVSSPVVVYDQIIDETQWNAIKDILDDCDRWNLDPHSNEEKHDDI